MPDSISDAASQTLLRDAVVKTDRLTSTRFLQGLFARWFDAFVYNQIWEDPRVDLQALELDESSRILTISSGGCNALNYLLAGPQSVTAVDLNRYHIYLLQLKVAAIRVLQSHEDFFNFFGTGKHPNNREKYVSLVRPVLEDDARRFWDQRIEYFVKGGLYNYSRNAYFLRFFHWFSHRLGCRPEKLLDAKSFSEQSEYFDRYAGPFFDSWIIKAIGKMPVTMFGLGIPPQQYDELKSELVDGKTVIDIYRERARRLACDYPIGENYFAWQAFARRYDTENRKAIPEYLKAENYDRLRTEVHKLAADVYSVTDEILCNATGTFNRFVFLDAQDWMDSVAMTALWSAITTKAEAGARIIFRTAGSRSPLEPNLPGALLTRFRYEGDRSAELFKQDRSSIYGGFHLYVFNG
jgi:S-adenosylmethionine-diacylglycerol 3-amino-3-carboxypropyl transferase